MLDLDLLRPLLDDRHTRTAEEAEEIAAAVSRLEPAHDDEAARLQARLILEMLGDARLPRHAVPEAWGGTRHGPDLRSCCLLRDALAAASPLADSVFALQCLGSMPLTLGAGDRLRRTWLPEVIEGRAKPLHIYAERQEDLGTSA